MISSLAITSIGIASFASLVSTQEVRNIPMTITPVTYTINPTHHKFESMEKIPARLFADSVNMFILDDGSIVCHSKMANTLERRVGQYASMFGEGPANHWMQVLPLGRAKIIKGRRKPITPVVSATAGDGGSIKIAFDKSFGRSLSIDLPFVMDNLLPISKVATFSATHSSGYSISGSLKCQAAAGESVQLVSQAYFTMFPGYKLREIKPNHSRTLGWFDRVDLEYMEWETNEEPSFVPSFFKKPRIQCMKRADTNPEGPAEINDPLDDDSAWPGIPGDNEGEVFEPPLGLL